MNRTCTAIHARHGWICCALLAFAIAHAPLVSLAAGRQLPLAPIDLLPNAPTTYQMRDWHQVATDFDSSGI